MKLSVLLLILACFTLGACASGRRPQPTTPTGEIPDLAKHQEMAALAFLAYLGELVKGTDDEVEQTLAPCMVNELKKQPLTRDKWTLVWGPAVYKFAFAELDDNMMYIVQETEQPSHLVIAVRGTNAKAILDWLIEDLEVNHQEGWPYGNPPKSLQPKISQGTHSGLTVLQQMVPASGVPGEGQTLHQFLAAQTAVYPTLQVDVTGHSLGGALSPTLALWLADTQADWDPAGKAQLAVYPLAGPTAGNTDFATYSDSRIGAVTHRLHNPHDVVPLAWNHHTMGTIAGLYKPHAEASVAERLLIDVARDEIEHKGYSQIRPQAPPLHSALNSEVKGFLGQLGWQHTCGYHCALGLVEATFLPITLNCQNDPPPPCPVCPPRKNP